MPLEKILSGVIEHRNRRGALVHHGSAAAVDHARFLAPKSYADALAQGLMAMQ